VPEDNERLQGKMLLVIGPIKQERKDKKQLSKIFIGKLMVCTKPTHAKAKSFVKRDEREENDTLRRVSRSCQYSVGKGVLCYRLTGDSDEE
jgi:hypothetical protein